MTYKRTRIIAFLLILISLFNQPVLARASQDAFPLSYCGISEYDGSGVRIALIDTGVLCEYIDPANIAVGNNYVLPDSDVNDRVGHGTAIAGIILGSKVLGLEGITPGANIVPLVYYSRYITGVPINGGIEATCKAIYDAVDLYNCRIINISSGIIVDNEKLREAIAYAEKKNVLIVSAVGNSNLSLPDAIYYPAAYETVIGVGATDNNNEVADFSQRNTSVKLLAPGTDILTVPISNSSKPMKVSGSSYAAAYVTGAAALLLEANPKLSAPQLRDILYNSARDIGPEGYDTETGWGMLDISKALLESNFLNTLL